MHNFDEIQLPSEEEKNQSIKIILDYGILEKKKLTVSLSTLYKSIGLKGIFFGVEDCAFLSILIFTFSFVFLFLGVTNNTQIICVLLFSTSPFLYMLLHLLTIWKEIMVGTYELKMVCRHSLRQMTVLRMLVFGSISILMSVFISTCLWFIIGKGISIVRLMSLSFSALFLFGLAQMLVERKCQAPKSYLIVPIIWSIMSIVLLILREHAEQILLQIPTAIFCILTILMAVLYGYSIKQYYFENKEGAITHAFTSTRYQKVW